MKNILIIIGAVGVGGVIFLIANTSRVVVPEPKSVLNDTAAPEAQRSYAHLFTDRYVPDPEFKPTQYDPATPAELDNTGLIVSDLSDDRLLIGSSHYIFMGKVVEQVGNVSGGFIPMTQYSVEVLYNIKGSLAGTLTVNQVGGFDSRGRLRIMGTNFPRGIAAGEYLLQPGSTYVMATRLESRWLSLYNWANAITLVTSDANLDRDQVVQIARDHPRARELLQLYPTEVVDEYDVSRSKAHNAFTALSTADKQAVYARIAEFAPSPSVPSSTSR